MNSDFFTALLALYSPLIVFLASRVPISGDKRPSWIPWTIGLFLAFLGIGAILGGIYLLSAFAGITGRMDSIADARNAMLHNRFTLLFAGGIIAPHVLSLALLATDGFSMRLVPNATARHWLYFALIYAVLAIAGRLILNGMFPRLPA